MVLMLLVADFWKSKSRELDIKKTFSLLLNYTKFLKNHRENKNN